MRAPTGRQLLPQTGWPPPTVDAQGLVSPVRDSEFFYSAPTGAHRGAQPLSWESGPSLMAPPLLWTPGTAAAQAPGLVGPSEPVGLSLVYIKITWKTC